MDSALANAIAFQGEIEILNAAWSLDSGRTVEFRLCGEAYDRVHPFKIFQRRRGGRVGTRFRAVFANVDSGEQLLTMDVMLAGWKDSSSVGQSVILWLDDEVDVHPFCGVTRRKNSTPGDIFALVLVELNDDETAVAQNRIGQDVHQGGGQGVSASVHDSAAVTAGAPASRAAHGAASGGGHATKEGSPQGGATPRRAQKLSSSVHLLVTSPIFVRWLKETKGSLVKDWTQELARQYAKQVIKVESLSDLDRDPEAVKRFHENIRRPYERWYRQEP